MKFFPEAPELFVQPFDLLPRCGALLCSQFRCLGAGHPPLRAVHYRDGHIQITDQFGAGPGRDLRLTLRFEEQPGVVQNALAHRG